MLQVKNLCITHKKDLRELVSNLNFVLNDGDKAAIIGEEGNGKSTLLKLLYDTALVSDYIEWSGEIIKNNCIFGYLGQELSQRDGEMSIYNYLSEEPGFLETETKELAMYAGRLHIPLPLLYAEQRMDTLSGGEKIKVCMIRILCRRPDVLLLDEPSNDIDMDTLLWLEEFILEWEGAVLFISHDETLLEGTANRIIHLEQVKKKKGARNTVKSLDYESYVAERAGGLKKQEQLAKKERSEYKAKLERLRQIEQKVEHQQGSITRAAPHEGKMLKRKMHAVKSMEKRFEKEFSQMTEIPDVEEAIFMKFSEIEALPAGKTVLDVSVPELAVEGQVLARDIHLRVVGGEKICLTGRNGAGKTTLLKKLVPELLARTDIKAAYIPQKYEDIKEFGSLSEATPVDFLSESGDKAEVTKIRTYLGSLKYTLDEMNHPIYALSGGQKAKLLLLKIAMSGANVLILDEPTRNFSPLSGPVIRRMLAGFKGAVISVSHDRKFIEEVCDKEYVLTEEGLVLREGT